MRKQLLTKCKHKKKVYKRWEWHQVAPGRLSEEWDQESLDKCMVRGVENKFSC